MTEAIQQATKELEEQKGQLAITIHNDIVSQIKRDLELIEDDPKMPFLPKDEKQPRKFEQNIHAVLEKPKESTQAESPTPFQGSDQ